MATEVLIELDTVEPTAPPPRVDRPVARLARPVLVELPVQPRVGLRTRLESCRSGRAVLGLTRWAVALALVAAGYCAAAGVSAGVECAFRTQPAPENPAVLAAASQK